MLSKSAFNALLKTLEEPPAHVMFIFATTEIRKVPVTILSRCQRFDLQRISIETLVKLFHKVLAAENIEAEDEALHMVARAADGSARDGLSMLDQAIVLGNGKIENATVKNMLGLADRQQTFAMYEKLLEGNVAEVLQILHQLYSDGATPMLIIQDLVDITHLLAKVKIIPDYINDSSVGENDREMCKKLNAAPISILSKIWQMLIKGISELQYANVQIDALEMILMRIAYSANMPTPADLLKELKKKSRMNNLANKPQIVLNSSTCIANTNTHIASELTEDGEGFELSTPEELVKLLNAKRQMLLLYAVKNDMSFKEFTAGKMRIALSEKADKDLIANLRKFLAKETGVSWVIDIDYEPLGETLAFKENKELERDKKNISEYPLVKAILSEFSGAKIETVIRKAVEDAEDEEAAEFVVPEENSETYDDEDN